MIQLLAVWNDQWKPKQGPKEKEDNNDGNNRPHTDHLVCSRSALTMAMGAGNVPWAPMMEMNIFGFVT